MTCGQPESGNFLSLSRLWEPHGSLWLGFFQMRKGRRGIRKQQGDKGSGHISDGLAALPAVWHQNNVRQFVCFSLITYRWNLSTARTTTCRERITILYAISLHFRSLDSFLFIFLKYLCMTRFFKQIKILLDNSIYWILDSITYINGKGHFDKYMGWTYSVQLFPKKTGIELWVNHTRSAENCQLYSNVS